MKRIKQTLALVAVLAALLAVMSPAAQGIAPEDITVVLESDDHFLSPVQVYDGTEFPAERDHMLLRLEALARAYSSRTYNCSVYAACVESPALMEPGFDSFEAMKSDFLSRHPDALGETSICLLYDQESGEALIHVGSAIRENCDTAPALDALRDKKGGSSYERMAAAVEALRRSIGKGGALLICSPWEDCARVQKNLEPLREKFTGPVYVIYDGGRGEDGSRLNEFRILYQRTAMLNFFYKDTIMIYYYWDTGAAWVELGEDIPLRAVDLDAVQAAFQPGGGPMDYSGFRQGVQALADSLAAGRAIPAYVGPLLLGAAAAVLALAVGIEAMTRKRGRFPTVEEAGK